MTHLNHQTNGASLEDCHTNFFALTDLCGIKWRKLVWGETSVLGGGVGNGLVAGCAINELQQALDDPVISSYARCLAGDILCVWRRVASPPPPSSGGGMFGDLGLPGPPPPPPPQTTSHHHQTHQTHGLPLSLTTAKELWIFWYGEEPDLSELVAPELLSPESEQGSWESGLSYECRSLLFKALHNLIERCLLSRDFVKLGKWFVQPYTGSKKIAGASTTHFSFSFAFFVHGESTVCASVDVRRHPAVRRISRRHLMQAQSMPTPVPVILAPFGLAGVLTGQVIRPSDATARLLDEWRRFYPLDNRSSLRDPDAPPAVVEVLVGGIKMRYPACYVLITDMDEDTPLPTVMSIDQDALNLNPMGVYSVGVSGSSAMSPADVFASELPERVWQECIQGCPIVQADDDGQWNFVDPTAKSNCTCSKCRKHVGQTKWSSSLGKISKSGTSSDRGTSKGSRVPFHRRSPPPPPPPLLPPPPSSLDRQPGSCTPQGGPPSYPRNQTDSLPIASVGSPGSAAPSPLPNPPSQQPTSTGGCGEHMTSTLSPQHPPASAPGASASPHTPTPPASIETRQVPSVPPPQISNSASACNTSVSSSPPTTVTLKRPVLTSREYETALLEDEQPLELLYDYTMLDAWLNHPVKRFKGDKTGNWKSKTGDLYANHIHNNGQSANNLIDMNGTSQVFIKQEIQESNIDCAIEGKLQPMIGMKRPGDPYEFDDHDNQSGGMQIDGFKRGSNGNIKEEVKETKPNVDLFTTEGLQPSYKDLDQIFDNSDDTSSDEALQVQTPPGSNKSVGPLDDTNKRLSNSHTSGTGILRSEELSKMFPTPPSLEHNPIASPCGQMDVVQSLEPTEIKQEIYPSMGSPKEEDIDDWSYVFRPPAICKTVGSSKYAPLTNLPSQSLPPIVLPSHCVYKPSWRKPNSSVGNNVNSIPNQNATLPRRTPCPPLPPPPPYELPSPATSTTSSYMNKPPNSVEPATPSLRRPPEADSLLVNILLADTALNIFRDHNFDSCTLCVCNAGPKIVGNIHGADAGMYLVPIQPPGSPITGASSYLGGLSPSHHTTGSSSDDDPIRCSCGFSAIVNRRLSHRSGLFYEDELEITGIAEDPVERKKPSLLSCLLSTIVPENRERVDAVPQSVIEMLREQCVIVQSNSNSLFRAARSFRGKSSPPYASTVNILEFTDGNEITSLALDVSGKAPSGSALFVHRWPFLRAAGPHCNQDIVRVMKILQPLLQEAIQKKCTTRLWEAPYTVKGPLTWRQFHRLAGRGTDDRCEPQPIPSLIVGHDKDWLSLSPYALQHWDKLLLEPYSYARDIAYIVVAPDDDAISPYVKKYFRELSTSYEVCKLGKHLPITKIARDGIIRVGKASKVQSSSEPLDEWFSMLGDGKTCDMLRLYAQVCKDHLASQLSQVPMDRTLLEPPEGITNPNTVTAPLPTSSENAPATPKSESCNNESEGPTLTAAPQLSSDTSHEEDEGQPPSVVIYLIEPFTMNTDRPELQRLACLALLRCYASILAVVSENVRSNLKVQLISLESIVEFGKTRGRAKQSDHMRALALNVFSQCRRLLIHTSNVKSLTGFGTAAMADLFLKSKDEKNRAPYKLYTPPYILAPLKERAESAESFGQISSEDCSVLYISYCLSEDQSWLIAVATDERGELLETVIINIDVPNRSRRRKASARRFGLQRLMDFILGVMSQSVRPWRLVVGRIGRIGHGELKGWSWLLSRKALLKASKHLKELCGQCSLTYPSGVPCILSACLVSLEPDSTLRLMPDQFTPDERFSQASVNCQLSTPHDVSCTHILVFPTSATTQSSQTAFQEQHINGPELGDDELFKALNDDMPEGIDEMNDFNDIFNWTENGPGGGQSPGTSPRREGESAGAGSPGGLGSGNRPSPFPCREGGVGGVDHAEEVGPLLQQPLALGYLVSTAPTGKMPSWFWASCPHLEFVCPSFLKNALHLHSPAIQNSDDLLQQQSTITVHPLDSQFTTDVLRYVLEGYNALSWLAIDSNSHDRLSCLPVHIQVLMQLYHMTASLL